MGIYLGDSPCQERISVISTAFSNLRCLDLVIFYKFTNANVLMVFDPEKKSKQNLFDDLK